MVLLPPKRSSSCSDHYAGIGPAHICQLGCHEIPLGIAIGWACAHIDHRSVTIVGEHMTQVPQLRRSDTTFAVQLAVWIGDGSITGVTALLAMPVVRLVRAGLRHVLIGRLM
jgi:phosphoglucomutase